MIMNIKELVRKEAEKFAETWLKETEKKITINKYRRDNLKELMEISFINGAAMFASYLSTIPLDKAIEVLEAMVKAKAQNREGGNQ